MATGCWCMFVITGRVAEPTMAKAHSLDRFIGADLPRLGRALPGQTLRFVEVGIDQALAARRQAANDLAACIAGMVPSGAQLDLIALYNANLIDGVIDARQANQP